MELENNQLSHGLESSEVHKRAAHILMEQATPASQTVTMRNILDTTTVELMEESKFDRRKRSQQNARRERFVNFKSVRQTRANLLRDSQIKTQYADLWQRNRSPFVSRNHRFATEADEPAQWTQPVKGQAEQLYSLWQSGRRGGDEDARMNLRRSLNERS